MARTGYCNYPSGNTPTFELVLRGTNVVAQSVVPTEQSLDKQGYTWTITVGLAAGVYKINFKESSYYVGYSWITIGAADGTYEASDDPLDWGNVLNATATQNLTGTTVADVTAVSATLATISTALLAIAAAITTVLSRLGGFAGSGVNTVLGLLKAIMSKTASTPSDVGGTFSATTDSLEALQESVAAIDVGAGTGPNQLLLTFTDEDGDPLEGAYVVVRLNGEVVAYDYTDAAGLAELNVAVNGTYRVLAALGAFSFGGADLIVDGDEEETYEMTTIGFTPPTFPVYGLNQPHSSPAYGLNRVYKLMSFMP